MQTMMTTVKRGRNVYDPINMPVAEFKARIKDIQAEMKKKKYQFASDLRDWTG